MNSINTIKSISLLSLLALVLTGCYESSTEEAPPSLQQTAINGKQFYQDNCAVCHAAGQDDTSTAFNASDLAQSQTVLGTDLSMYGGQYQLMGQFANVPAQQLAELKAYLATL